MLQPDRTAEKEYERTTTVEKTHEHPDRPIRESWVAVRP